MFWEIRSYPTCTHHVFLSHCQENRDDLVRPVYETLVADGVAAWLDQADYTYGRDSRAALKDGVLRSRHAVFFVTPEMIATGRGWCAFELAFAEILQTTLVRSGGPLANVVLPLFFLPQADPVLPRTVWQAARDRGRFHDAAKDGNPVGWAHQEILRFLRDEQRLATEIQVAAGLDRGFQKELKSRPGLWERVARVDPSPVP